MSPRAREYCEQLGMPQGPPEPEELDPFQETRNAMNRGTGFSCGKPWEFEWDMSWKNHYLKMGEMDEI